jgi:hypothetical protein
MIMSFKFAFAAFAAIGVSAPALADQDAFWASMTALCGNAYEGRMTHARGQEAESVMFPQVMHVHQCDENRIAMRYVQDQTPNYWHRIVIRHPDGRLELRHDYRNADGTPTEGGDYGGFTPNQGSAAMQIFPADDHTVQGAATGVSGWTNPWGTVWVLEVEPDVSFGYSSNILGTPVVNRFEFDLSRTVPVPPAWDWLD